MEPNSSPNAEHNPAPPTSAFSIQHSVICTPRNKRRALKEFLNVVIAKTRYWAGALTITAFQIAPITMQRDETGQFSLALGYGIGDFKQKAFNCIGRTWDRSVNHNMLTGIAEYISPGGKIHATVMSGNMNTSVGLPRRYSTIFYDNQKPDFPAPLDGAFVGALIGSQFPRQGRDWPPIDLQAGVISLPRGRIGNRVEPSFRLRIHEPANLYTQIDHLTILTPGQIPMSSVGMGFGDPDRIAKPAGFFAVVMPRVWKYRDQDRIVLALRGDLSLPIGKNGDVSLGGVLGGSSLNHISAGVRLYTRGRTEVSSTSVVR